MSTRNQLRALAASSPEMRSCNSESNRCDDLICHARAPNTSPPPRAAVRHVSGSRAEGGREAKGRVERRATHLLWAGARVQGAHHLLQQIHVQRHREIQERSMRVHGSLRYQPTCGAAGQESEQDEREWQWRGSRRSQSGYASEPPARRCDRPRHVGGVPGRASRRTHSRWCVRTLARTGRGRASGYLESYYRTSIYFDYGTTGVASSPLP